MQVDHSHNNTIVHTLYLSTSYPLPPLPPQLPSVTDGELVKPEQVQNSGNKQGVNMTGYPPYQLVYIPYLRDDTLEEVRTLVSTGTHQQPTITASLDSQSASRKRKNTIAVSDILYVRHLTVGKVHMRQAMVGKASMYIRVY